MIAALRRLAWLDRVAAAYAAVYFGWHLAKAAGAPVPSFVADAAFFPLGLAIGWLNWRNSHVGGLDRRTRTAWRLLALAALVLWVSGSTWTIWLAMGGSGRYAAWIDRVAFVQYILSIAGYLYFPERTVPRGAVCGTSWMSRSSWLPAS